MDSLWYDTFEVIVVILSSLTTFTFFLISFGIVFGLLMVFYGLLKKQKLKIDWSGLFICATPMLLFLTLPLGLLISGEGVEKKFAGYFGVADFYTWVIVYLVTTTMTFLSFYRLFKMREQNFGASFLLFALLTVFAFTLGQIVSSQFGGAWAS